jgi:hypothetical protein
MRFFFINIPKYNNNILFTPIPFYFLSPSRQPPHSITFVLKSHYYWCFYELDINSPYEEILEFGIFLSMWWSHTFSCERHNFTLNGWVIHHCVYMPHFLYSFIICSASRLIPFLCYCNNATIIKGVQVYPLVWWFLLLQIYPQRQNSRIIS